MNGMKFPTPEFGNPARHQWTRNALLIVCSVASILDEEPVLVEYGDGETKQHWWCFDVGERKFGIWRSTLALYEQDEMGAMGVDEVRVGDLVGDPTA